jgi:AmmeMemoRadiSam system protein A
MHPLVELAISSVKHHLIKNEHLTCPDPLPLEMKGRAGTFVSIKKNGLLRGCIGTISPKYKNVAEEVIQNAIKAATKDSRFPSIELQEIKELTLSVDLLMEPEQIYNLSSLNVKLYGLIVSSKEKTGLMLPNLKNIKTIDQQLKTCLKKSGLKETDKYELYRFRTKRFY